MVVSHQEIKARAALDSRGLLGYHEIRVRRASVMEECRKTWAYAGTLWALGAQLCRPLCTVSSMLLKGVMRKKQASKMWCLA